MQTECLKSIHELNGWLEQRWMWLFFKIGFPLKKPSPVKFAFCNIKRCSSWPFNWQNSVITWIVLSVWKTSWVLDTISCTVSCPKRHREAVLNSLLAGCCWDGFCWFVCCGCVLFWLTACCCCCCCYSFKAYNLYTPYIQDFPHWQHT